MSSAKLAKGTAVVSLADGTQLGTIDHVYLDPRRKEIVGFTFQNGGLFGSRTSGLVDVSDVRAFGPDAVTIDSAAAVRSELAVEARDDELIDLGELLKRKVITEGGTMLGQVAAIHFGQDSCALTAIDVSPGLFQPAEAVDGEDVVNIGAELIVVADPALRREAAAPRAGEERPPLFYVVEPDRAERRAAG